CVSAHPTGRSGNGAVAGTSPAGGGIAVSTTPPKVRFTASTEGHQASRKRRRKRIAIRHRSGDQVVAIIEIVSPRTKGSQHALREFAGKAAELLDAGIHLLIIDLFPPGRRDPQGIHGAVWSQFIEDGFQLPADKPLTLVAYAAGEVKNAYIEPVAVGDTLPDMPLFLSHEVYVPVPLEVTYRTAWEGVPRRWRDVLEPPTS